MIDPQMQANKWIKNLEKENDLKVIKTTENPGKRVTECLALVNFTKLS
jgi:dynein heavy chain, axonemal